MYEHILVAVDGSETASRALDAALALAKLTGATLQALYVVDVPILTFDAPGYDPSIAFNAFIEEGKRVSADARDRMARAGVAGDARVVEVSFTGGEDVAHCIQIEASAQHADLLVLGTHGRRGVRRLVLGSVAERTVRGAPCPVLLVPANATQTAAAAMAEPSQRTEAQAS